MSTEEKIINQGGAAFPMPGFEEGMSMRDYFAAQAIGGILANQYQDQYTDEEQAERAYSIADAMIERRYKL